MLRLILVRHAKSAWGDAALSDFDRPLAPRGRRAAAWIGETLRREGWIPDQILCSPAARTRETLALSGVEAADQGFEQGIYDRRDEDYVDLLHHLGRGKCLMLVGHNMAISATGAALANGGLDMFATGQIAVLDFDAATWETTQAGSGSTVAFRKPPKD